VARTQTGRRVPPKQEGSGCDATHVALYERAHRQGMTTTPGRPLPKGATVSPDLANPALAHGHHQSQPRRPWCRQVVERPGVHRSLLTTRVAHGALPRWTGLAAMGELDRGRLTRRDPGDVPGGDAVYGLPGSATPKTARFLESARRVELPFRVAAHPALIALGCHFLSLLAVGLFAQDAVLAERQPCRWSVQGEPSC
jgi:hypothetical protein